MEWSLSETIALASEQCVHCHGLGMRRSRRGREHPCECVFRAIFRACYARFRDCVQGQRRCSTISLHWSGASAGKQFYGRKVEEYIADFCLVSRRALSESDYRLFRYYFLLGADSTLCCRYLDVDKTIFFHNLYRIEETLGRVYRELTPHPLFPLDEYFDTVIRKSPARLRMERLLRRSGRKESSGSVPRKIA